jgi:hypothetical protein
MAQPAERIDPDATPADAPSRRTPIRRTPVMDSTESPAFRLIDRGRRSVPRDRWTMPRPFTLDATFASFALEGINLSLGDVTRFVSHRQSVRSFRSRLYQRVRNHVAILHHIERLIARRQPVTVAHTLGWYASLSSGLCTEMPAPAKLQRIESVVARVNSPQLRLHLAMLDAASLYVALLRDELVPGFNGILARLLLHAHLGRCGLLPVILGPALDGDFAGLSTDAPARLAERLAEHYDRVARIGS